MTDNQSIDEIFRLHVLGVGNFRSEQHPTVSFVIEASSWLILLEPPYQTILRLAQHRRNAKTESGKAMPQGIEGLTLDKIGHIIATHADLDHCAGLNDIALYKWYEQDPSILKGDKPPFLYASDSVACSLERVIQPALSENCLEFRRCYDVFRFAPQKEGYQSVEIGPVNVSICPADHVKSAFGVLFEYRGRKLSYSGDTRFHQPLVDFLSQADVMVHECDGKNIVHTEPEELNEWLDSSGYERNGGKLYVCHFDKATSVIKHGLRPLVPHTVIDI